MFCAPISDSGSGFLLRANSLMCLPGLNRQLESPIAVASLDVLDLELREEMGMNR